MVYLSHRGDCNHRRFAKPLPEGMRRKGLAVVRLEMKEAGIMEQRFFICEHCGNIIAMVRDSGVPVVCCGEKMKEIIPGTTDAAVEKHVPVYTVEGNTVHVTVGAVEHPMQPEHYIEWISLQTRQGNQRKALKPGDAPRACFAICEGDEVEAVYAYCNLHSLWKA